MGGINFVDIAYLKTDNIVDGRLIYTRRKTHKLIRLPLQPTAREIIDRYQQDGALFLFPILSAFHKTEQQQRNRVHKVISKVNERLKEVGKELEIRTYRAIERNREFYGILTAYDDNSVTILEEDGTERVFQKSDIALIRLAFDF